MPQVIRSLCDLCFRDGEESAAGHTFEATLSGVRPRLVLLCERHHAEWWLPFVSVLDSCPPLTTDPARTRGRPPGRRHSDGEPGSAVFPCPVGGCEYGPYASRTALVDHVGKRHPGVSLPTSDPVACPAEGCDRVLQGVRGLVQHAAVHGLDGAGVRALLAARDRGD